MLEDVVNKDGINFKVSLDTTAIVLLTVSIFLAVVVGGILVNVISKRLN